MTQDDLRKQVKLYKALNNISYKRLAELIGVKTNSFYSWLNAQYDLGYGKAQKLRNIVSKER